MGKVNQDVMRFVEAFGGAWIPVKFHQEAPMGEPKKCRFCEALSAGKRQKILLTPNTVTCPGASRSFGWPAKPGIDLAEKLATKLSISPDAVDRIMARAPKLAAGMSAVEVSGEAPPDVLLAFTHPIVALEIARAVEQHSDGPLRPSLSTVFSVCGNTAVRSFLTGKITISMGSPDSRACAGIGRDQLILGVPWARALELLANGSRRD